MCTSCRISQLISSSKRSSVPKVIVFLLCRLNFTWNTAELPQLASAHHGIRILAFFQSFGSAANRNRANHTNLVPEREGSDEALILAYGLVRQCLEVPHMVPQNAVHKYPRLLWTAWRSTRSAQSYMLCLSVLMVTVLPNLVFVVRRSPVIPVKNLGRYF